MRCRLYARDKEQTKVVFTYPAVTVRSMRVGALCIVAIPTAVDTGTIRRVQPVRA